MFVISWGYPPQTRTQETFREKFLGTSKAFAKMKWCGRRKVFADFQGAFYKKPLKARFGTAVPTYYDKLKSTAMPCFFCVYYQLGLSAPSPDPKDFSGKVLWKLKSFHQNEVMYSVGNSFAYFSYKKSRWHTFLRKKGV